MDTGSMESLTAARSMRPWQRPSIAFEMPFSESRFVNGCAGDGGSNPATTNTFTPVVKIGAAQDALFITCISAS
jgi:hypothetical protein